MKRNPGFLATGIGSMPFSDAERAASLALEKLPEAPVWPQLPRIDSREQMEIQYSEGMPRAIVNAQTGSMHFDTSGDYSDDLAGFYESYLAAMDPEEGNGDCSSMAISRDYSQGLYALEGLLQKTDKLPFVKVQTTGPCSFALTVTDQNKRAIYYNEEFRDMVVKALAMKSRWQVQRYRDYADQVICFIDEPILSAFGSSTYVAVDRDDVIVQLSEVVEAIHADGALAGIHCCGNTDWSLPMETGADIVNFDAYQYGETIAMYPDAVQAHLERGGLLAWGVVPTSAAVCEETAASLAARLEQLVDKLASTGIDKQLILEHAVITPSCGTGSLEPDNAVQVLDLVQPVSELMRQKHLN